MVRLSEELCKEWGTRLDKAFSGGIPRQHLIWMWNPSDTLDQRNEVLSAASNRLGSYVA